jgi:hypothetical protein
MQRRELGQRLDVRQDAGVDPHGGAKLRPAMHHPMPDGLNPGWVELQKQRLHRPLNAFLPACIRPQRHLGFRDCRETDAVDDAPFQGTGADVQDQDVQ